jgi:hypothetical protein
MADESLENIYREKTIYHSIEIGFKIKSEGNSKWGRGASTRGPADV